MKCAHSLHWPSIIVSAFLLFMISPLNAQSTHKLKRTGDKAYKADQFTTAEENYRKAIEKKADSKAFFNLGNAVFQQDRFEEAAQHYESSAGQAKESFQKAEAFYNKGTAQLKEGKFEEAVDAYKNTLSLNPNDQDALRNLYMAKLLKKQQEQQQQQQQENQQQQDQIDQKEEQHQQEQQNQQQNTSDSSEEQQESSQATDSQEMSKEDAEKLLQVIENEDKNVQEKMRKASGNKMKPLKDW